MSPIIHVLSIIFGTNLYSLFYITLLKEAALYVQQGLDNEKFMKTVPPTSYKILHHPLCYWLIFFATLALLLLAIFERPLNEPTRADKAVSMLLDDNQGTKVANLFSIFFRPILLASRIFIKYQISYLTALLSMDQM